MKKFTAIVAILLASLFSFSQLNVNCGTLTACASWKNSDNKQIYSALLAASGATGAPCSFTSCTGWKDSDMKQIYGAILTLSATGSSTATAWNTIGNALGSNTLFIGSTDNRSYLLKANNVERIKIGADTATDPIRINGRVSQIGLRGSTYFGFNAGIVDNAAASYSNAAFGNRALQSCVGGFVNSAFGADALRNCTGGSNSAFGFGAMLSLVSGGNNSAFGESSLYKNIIGLGNCAFGKAAIVYGTTDYNCAFGFRSLESTTTGSLNFAGGAFSGRFNTTGSGNIFLGYFSGIHTTIFNNRLYISSLDRATLPGDTTLSIIYGYQSANTVDQRLYLNARTFFAEDLTMGVSKSVLSDFITDRTNNFSLIYRASSRTNIGAGGTMVVLDNGSVKIGSSTAPVASAILEASSTTQGFLPPCMTTTQKNAIVAPATGLMLYDTTLNKLCVFTGSAWETITSL